MMEKIETYCLQSRWQLERSRLIYYGLRAKGGRLLKNEIRVSARRAAILSTLPRPLNDAEKKTLGELLGDAVVELSQQSQTPASLQEARFCTTCAANDFIIPGLTFDADGICPLCATAKDTDELCSVLPVKNHFPRASKSRFDVALFYTGGKDSTFLLYYLAKCLSLRVLAMTWEIPFLSESAKQSIENAKKHFSNVEFISRTVNAQELSAVYRALYQRTGNCCACPSLAYVLFYPEMVANRVPYFVAGNEPVQMLGLYYNRMAPKFAYRFAKNKPLNLLLNVGRALTLRPPLRSGQVHTLMTMKQLAYGDHPVKKMIGYRNELVENVVAALHTRPLLLHPLKKAIRLSSRTGNIPAFVHVDLDVAAGGCYDWRKIRSTIVRECGWVAPDGEEKGLHTSCKIEKCKEYSQFLRFYHMESRMIPFSALEISLASRKNNLSREQAIREMQTSLGFSLTEPAECAFMKDFMDGAKPSPSNRAVTHGV